MLYYSTLLCTSIQAEASKSVFHPNSSHVLLLLCSLPAADVDASLQLKKSLDLDLDLPAGELSSSGPVIMNMAANPSAPPTTAAAAEPQVLLSLRARVCRPWHQQAEGAAAQRG
jgi:hypothetical protein